MFDAPLQFIDARAMMIAARCVDAKCIKHAKSHKFMTASRVLLFFFVCAFVRLLHVWSIVMAFGIALTGFEEHKYVPCPSLHSCGRLAVRFDCDLVCVPLTSLLANRKMLRGNSWAAINRRQITRARSAVATRNGSWRLGCAHVCTHLSPPDQRYEDVRKCNCAVWMRHTKYN